MAHAAATTRLPVSAVVIFRNEERHLHACLPRLRFCDELIGIDMASTDGSRRVAQAWVDRLFEVDPFPIAEPTRVAAARVAKHDWLLLVDPDEYLPQALAREIAQALREHPDAGAVGLPWWFYFKGRHLKGTSWGGTHRHKLMLIHRDRCRLLPTCNRIVWVKPNWQTVNLPGTQDNHVRHHWCDSYIKLWQRHWGRYPRLDAQRRYADGERFSLEESIATPIRETMRSLRDFDGWRLGFRGWALSTVQGMYQWRQQVELWRLGRGGLELRDDNAAHGEAVLREVKTTPAQRATGAAGGRMIHPRFPREKLLVITAAFPPMLAGESAGALRQCQAFAARGLDVHVLTTRRDGLPAGEPFTLHPIMQQWNWREARRLKRLVKRLRPDAALLVFASWNYNYHPMISYAATLVKQAHRPCRFVTQVQWAVGTNAALFGRSARLVRRTMAALHHGDYSFGTLLDASDGVTVMCDEHIHRLREIRQHVSPRIVPPGVLLPTVAPPTRRERDAARRSLGVRESYEMLACFFGLIAPGKGLETLLRATGELLRRGEPVRLAIIGSPADRADQQAYDRAMRQLCTDLRLGERVCWTGAFEAASLEPSRWLWASDFAVLPWDAGARLNNSTLAAVAHHRLPIITTRAMDTDAALLEPGRMRFVPPGDVGRLADAMRELCHDSALRRRLTAGAMELDQQVYDFDRIITATLETLGLSPLHSKETRRAA